MDANVIVILPDQWRGDCLSYLNHPVVETPFLDELAYDGITFSSAYAAAPSCIPARACIATGQTPSTCGRIGYQDCVKWNYKNTLMQVLKDNNYQTINVGKTHFYPQRANLGFEVNYLYDPQNHGNFKSDYHYWLDEVSNGKIKDPALEWNNNLWVTFPWEADEYYHPTNWTTRTAKQALERRDPTRPFYLQIGYHRPHPPYDPPKYYYNMYKDKELPELPIGEWAEKYGKKSYQTACCQGKINDDACDRMRRAYYGSITHIDAQIGSLMFWLQQNGLYYNSYIIFLSDHGELLGDHYMYRKVNPWEGSAKIPFIIKPPAFRKCKRGIKNNDIPITHMDLMPTILQELGINIPDSVEGKSLTPLIDGEDINERTYIHGEHTGYGRTGWQFITDGKIKYIWETYSGDEFLFDLEKDPEEKNNLIYSLDYTDILNVFRNRLINELAKRPQDGLSDGKRLISGKVLNATRKELLE